MNSKLLAIFIRQTLCLLLLWSVVPLLAAATGPLVNAVPLAELARAGQPLPMQVRAGVPTHVTVQDVAAMPDHTFAAFDPDKAYDADRFGVLWLRFQALADDKSGAAAWTLSLSTPFVDKVSFFYLDEQGVWQGQFAGRDIPNARWPIPGTYPRFNLPTLAPGVHTFYVRVQTGIPRQYSIKLQSTENATSAAMSQLLHAGFVLSLMAFTGIISLILAAVYKRKLYVWYSLFGLTSFFAVAGYIGISNYLFWPHASVWPKYLTLVPVMLALTIHLHFSRILFANELRHTRIRRVVKTLLLFNLACTLATVIAHILPNAAFRIYAYAWVMTSSVVLSIFIVLRAWRQGFAMAPWWVLGYTPLFVFLALVILQRFEQHPIGALPINMLLYVIAFQLPILLFILLWHSKTHHVHAVRETTLASVDPLKGYIPACHFAETAQNLWDDACQQKKDLGIAYVKVTRDRELAALVNKYDPQRERALWVRIMRTVMRDGDTVAQIDEDTFALFFNDLSASQAFSNRLSRLVALGQAAPKDYQTGEPIAFRVVASSLGSVWDATRGSSHAWGELDLALRAKLSTEAAESRSLRFLGAVPVEPQVPDENHSEAWAQALNAQLADERKPG